MKLSFRKDESGATLVEYGVALVLAIVVGGTGLIALGEDVSDQMGFGCDAMNTGITTATLDCN